jgi:hypothetical protein
LGGHINPRRFGWLVALVLFCALPAAAHANGRVASAIGVKQVKGERLYVDVVVAVPPGQSARQATDEALSQQGAKRREKPPWAGGPGGPPWAGGPGGPPWAGGGGDEEYFYTGLEWTNFPVVQNYNSANEPLDAKSALTDTHSEWSNVSGSNFDIDYGADTDRCPSLVNECEGPQVKDPYNDVAWLQLGGNILGVIWYTTSDPEADMALNTRFAWKDTCTDSGNGYDVGTVYLHENGHVAGLGHVTTTAPSVMYPGYLGARCTLYPYDERSLANLYG